MSLIVRQVLSKKDLKTFIDFPNKLYKGSKYYVPKMPSDEFKTLSSSKNPVFEFSESAYFLAERDGKVVGRVAAILNKKANEKWNHKEIRFGWFDFVDDREVSRALLDKVVEYGRKRGMETISGPLGFTDFDAEGMLVEGFDHISTMALTFNYPYYKEHMEALGYVKEVDWLEYKIFIPDELPERIPRVAELVSKRYGFKLRKITRKEVRQEQMGRKIFKLVNECYGQLYNFTPLTDRMIDSYVDAYLGILDLDFISLVEDSKGEIIGFAITTPSITRALQKCKGRIFPFGWIPVLWSMFVRHEESVELMLIGVKPEHRNKGVMAMLFNDLIPRMKKGGFKYGESNAELEYNHAMQNPWEMFDKEQTKRRRIYTKSLK